MKRRGSLLVLGIAATMLGLSTAAGVAADHQPSAEAWQKYFLHLGYSAVPYDENAVVSTPGGVIPGANIRLDTSYTAYFEAGYFLTPNFAISLSSGYPPTVTTWGTGTAIDGLSLGKVTGGIIELNAQYHFRNFGAFQPYVGAGPAYFHVFGTEDGVAENYRVKDAFGFNIQAGADWMLSQNFGLFFDVKKVFVSTAGDGILYGLQPSHLDVRLDPMIISAGLTLRY